ncbi:MAG: type ISP restriction/modification enzyme [Candidatus Acidiferrales bacterium]
MGDHTVEKVRYADPNPKAGIKAGRVYINGVQYFDGVPKEVWEFQIGGYQVCEKWLKDRKGRKLSSDDIDHYQKIVVALNETIRLMREIDETIPGWPLP